MKFNANGSPFWVPLDDKNVLACPYLIAMYIPVARRNT